MINRTNLWKQIKKAVDGSESAIVLKGPAGVGKSHLLDRIIDHLKKKKYHAIVFRGAVSAEMILKRVADEAAAKGVSETETIFLAREEYAQKLEKLLESFIYKQNVLLAFDDFDPNLTSDGEFSNPRLKELIDYLKDNLKEKQSRMVLVARQELPDFETIEVEPFSWLEFQKLVEETATLMKLDEKSLKKFFFEMGGYPAAVRYLDHIARQEFGTRRFQWTGLRDSVPRLAQRILHKENESADFSALLVEKLVNNLDAPRRQILESLSIYRGPVTLEMLRLHIPDPKPHLLKKLVDPGLVSRAAKSGVYNVPALVRHIVLARMDEEEMKQSHLQAAQHLASSGSSGHYGQNNINARYHYLEAGEWDTALNLTFDMDNYFTGIGFPQFSYDLLKGMEPHLDQLEETSQVVLHNRLAILDSLFGNLDKAMAHHEAALAINHSREDAEAAAFNLGQMGMIYEAQAKYDEALDHYSQALEAAEKSDDNGAVAQRLQQMGRIQKQKGNYDDAYDSFDRALAIHMEDGNQQGMAANLEQLGRIHDEQGKFDRAIDYYKQSLALKRSQGDRQGTANLLHQLGNVHFFRGELDGAFGLYKESLQIKEELGDHKGAGYSLGQLGLIRQRQDDSDGALTYFEKSLDYFEEAGEQKGIAAGHHQLGRILESKDQLDDALQHYEKAVEIRETGGDLLGAAITYGQLGMLYLQKEEYETALRYSTKAYAVFTQYGSPNARLARNNMLRLREKLPRETFNDILKEFNINTQPTATGEGKEGK